MNDPPHPKCALLCMNSEASFPHSKDIIYFPHCISSFQAEAPLSIVAHDMFALESRKLIMLNNLFNAFLSPSFSLALQEVPQKIMILLKHFSKSTAKSRSSDNPL